MKLRKCIVNVLAWVLGTFIVLDFAWCFIVGYILNTCFNAEKLTQNFNENKYTNLYLNKIEYKTLPDFSLNIFIDKIDLKQNDTSIISADNLDLRIKTLPLLFKKTYIDKLNTDLFSLNLIKSKDGKINILEAIPISAEIIKNYKVKKLKSNINKYNLLFKDDLIKTNYKFNGEYIHINKYNANKNIELDTVGSMFSNNKKSNFHVYIKSQLPINNHFLNDKFDTNISIENLDISQFTPILKNKNINNITGIVNANIKTYKDNQNNKKQVLGTIHTQNIEIKGDSEETSTYLKEKAKIDLNAYIEAKNLILNQLTIKTKNHDVSIDGEIKNTNAKNPILDLNIDLKNKADNMFYWAIPSELNFENNLITKLKKYKPKANIQGNLQIKGKSTQPDIEGEILISNLFLDIPLANKVDANLKLNFIKDKIHIDSKIKTSENAYVNLDGFCEIYEKQATSLNITSSKNVDLTTTMAVLMPIQDTFSLNFGILNELTIDKGYGDANLHIEGTREDQIINGYVNFFNSSIKLNGLNTQIKEANGNINFIEKNVDFETKSAKIDGKNIKILGKTTLLGDYDLSFSANDIQTKTLLTTLQSSPLIKDINKNLKEINLIKDIIGTSAIDFNVKGKLDIKTLDMNIDEAIYNAIINTKNNIAQINNFPTKIKIKNGNFIINNTETKLKTNTQILNSPINTDITATPEKIKIYTNSDKFLLKDIIHITDQNGLYDEILSNKNLTPYAGLKFNAQYEGERENIDLDNLKVIATFHESINEKTTKPQGTITIKNGDVFINKVYLNILNSVLSLDGTIKNISSKSPDYNILLNLKNFNITNLNNISNQKLFNKTINEILSAYENYKGTINGNLKLQKNGLSGKLNTSDITFTHKKLQLPISMGNTELNFRNDTLTLPTMNIKIDDVPIFLKGTISNITKTPRIKGYITSNIYTSFVNKYVNPNLGYPIKLKGELSIKSDFEGTANAMKSTTIISFPIGSDLAYMGANLAEEDFDRELKLELYTTKNKIHILNETYSKYVTSLNGTRSKYPYITISGAITNNENPSFENLKIKTFAPTNSNIFNILFKKSVIKNGDFECDLAINGNLKKPRILGFAKFKNIDMPLYNTKLQDFFADFKQNNIELKANANILNTNVQATSVIENKLYPQFKIKSAIFKADYLNIDKILNTLSKVSLKTHINPKTESQIELNEIIQPNMFLIDSLKISANEILIKNQPATDLKILAHKNNNNLLKIDNFDFSIANGTINANGNFDLVSNKIDADCIAKSIDANKFSQLFLNTHNQIYGNLDGIVKLNTIGTSPDERIKNLNGDISFLIKDGKMPKLGSLEYLLRAGNVVKSGITGFTINNIIELLIPIKTGEFSEIRGDIKIEKGNAQDIKIYSKGKNLSLYLTGNSDINSHNTQIEIYGRLSKKVSTLFGPIGNTSLNTLFSIIPKIKLSENSGSEINNIPGLDTSTKDYRFFKATINGNINKEDYVQSFKWLE